MSLTAKKSGGDYTPAPAGTHLAICYGVIDLGTQEEVFEGKQKKSEKVRIVWELPNETTADGKPMSIGTFYTVSLHEKAKLRKHLEAWRGKPFTEEELKGFKLTNIIGKACMLVVVHKPRANGDGVSDSVMSVSIPMKGLPVPAMTNKPLIFDIENFDKVVYDSLPDFLKKMVALSPEGAAKLGYRPPVGGQNQPAGGTPGGEADGDIPF